MNRKLSDEQIDRIAKNLLRDFAPDDQTLAEIAESPRLWWNVRNAIETEKARRSAGFFARLRQPVLAFGALTALICLGLTVLFVSFGRNSNSTVAERRSVQNESKEITKTAAAAQQVLPSEKPGIPEISSTKKTFVKKPEPAKFVVQNRHGGNWTKRAQKASKPESTTAPREETKTDFIALSYAAETDSGQIVRVKVPSSMMVSLGVRTSVEKESELVQAEVVIGDDGMARAIRFIR